MGGGQSTRQEQTDSRRRSWEQVAGPLPTLKLEQAHGGLHGSPRAKSLAKHRRFLRINEAQKGIMLHI